MPCALPSGRQKRIPMKTHNFLWSAVAASTLLFFLPARAEVKMPAVFSDNMVLQQRTDAPVWGKARAGETVTVSVSWSKKKVSTVAGADGRWSLTVATPRASSRAETMTVSGDNTITIRNILIGEVWLCSGQSNMEFPVARDTASRWKTAMVDVEEQLRDADYPEMRLFRVEHRLAPDAPVDDCTGVWEVCTPDAAARFSAVGFVFGRRLYKELHRPVGLLQATWGGTHAESWMRREAMQDDPYYKELDEYQHRIIEAYPAEKKRYDREMAAYRIAKDLNPDTAVAKPASPKKINDNLRLSTLWNGMINPLLPYALRGVIWYQGESNDSRAAAYGKVFSDLIADWRTVWGQGEFPFYFVQIAPYYKQSPELRECQTRVWLETPHTGMAVITDAGDSTDIHPRNKKIPGERLAAWALSHDYGKRVPYMGPVYKGMTVEGSEAVLSFDYTGGGLVAAGGGALRGFVVAGADGVFHPAAAEIRGDRVIVSSPEVARPVAVRYGWDKFFRVNLANREGFPAVPFRTDGEK